MGYRVNLFYFTCADGFIKTRNYVQIVTNCELSTQHIHTDTDTHTNRDTSGKHLTLGKHLFIACMAVHMLYTQSTPDSINYIVPINLQEKYTKTSLGLSTTLSSFFRDIFSDVRHLKIVK